MKKIILIIFLLIPTFPCFGEWKYLATTIPGDILYVDTDRKREIDGYILVWMLIDFSEKDDFGDLSELSYVKIDCAYMKYMYLSRAFFSLPQGKGKRTDDGPVNKWIFSEPNSISELLTNSVC